MLSISNFKQLCDIIEESGGKWIVKDPETGIYLFTSPDPNRNGDYFKLLDKPIISDKTRIARIGIKRPEYEVHYRRNIGNNIFLKNDTIANVITVLGRAHNPAVNDKDLMAELLQKKNEQINEYNRATHQRITNLQNFSNWQAAIIYTNLINKHDKDKTIMNDSRLGDINPKIIPFNQEIPDYQQGLPESEKGIKERLKETRKYKRY